MRCYPNRVVLLSDTHYTTDDTTVTPKQESAGNILGYTQLQRVQFALSDVKAFAAEKGGLDAVMILGDLSTDDCGYRNFSTNYVEKFKTDFMDALQNDLSVPSYALAGNHDCYTSAEWNDIFGYERQYVVTVKGKDGAPDAKFIMLDMFEEGTVSSATGSAYTGMNQECYEFLKAELEKEFSGPTFLCSHYFRTPFSEDEMGSEFYNLLNQHPNVQCLFHGHSHYNDVITSSNIPGKYVVNTGGYAFDPNAYDGVYNFNRFDVNYAWGYQVLEWSDQWVRIYHVKPARSYVDSSGVTHTIEETLIEDKICFSLSK